MDTVAEYADEETQAVSVMLPLGLSAPTPHITVSTVENVAAVKSNDLLKEPSNVVRHKLRQYMVRLDVFEPKDNLWTKIRSFFSRFLG